MKRLSTLAAVLLALLSASISVAHADKTPSNPLYSLFAGVLPTLGPVNLVLSPVIDIDTRVGSPSTLVEKTPPPSSGINIVIPSLVRVKTAVDSPDTTVRAPPGSYRPAVVHADAAASAGVLPLVPTLASLVGVGSPTPAPLPARDPSDDCPETPTTAQRPNETALATPTPTPTPTRSAGSSSASGDEVEVAA